jgi:hypothetical protein
MIVTNMSDDATTLTLRVCWLNQIDLVQNSS